MAGGKVAILESIVLLFNGEVDPASAPVISKNASGSWKAGERSWTFTPKTPYPLSAKITITPPVGDVVTYSTPVPNQARATQILARLGYLPLSVTLKKPQPKDLTAEYAAALDPGAASYKWRFDLPTLTPIWKSNQWTVINKGALMTFQLEHDLGPDGVLGPDSWLALMNADLKGTPTKTPYANVVANLNLPERLTFYQNGKEVLTHLTESGVRGAETSRGTFPVYRKLASDRMRGTRPNGVKYDITGIPWVQYFNGGEAIHGIRMGAGGYPTSNGCLHLPPPVAQQAYGLTSVGTLVTVTGGS